MATLSTVLQAFSLLLLTSTLTTAEDAIVGPTAVISIASQEPFGIMKPCASSCLVYSGVWACGVNSGYYDLGIELSCGCSPQNFCYCDVDSASRASSYISSCVVEGCGTAFPSEVTSAIDLYNGYCSTANVAASTTSSSSTSTPTLLSSSTKSISATSKTTSTSNQVVETLSNSSASETNSADVVTTPTASDEKKKGGLTSSDVIALGVGLGVGVPSLLLGIATFCLQRRNRGRKQAAAAAAVMDKSHVQGVY